MCVYLQQQVYSLRNVKLVWDHCDHNIMPATIERQVALDQSDLCACIWSVGCGLATGSHECVHHFQLPRDKKSSKSKTVGNHGGTPDWNEAVTKSRRRSHGYRDGAHWCTGLPQLNDVAREHQRVAAFFHFINILSTFSKVFCDCSERPNLALKQRWLPR